MSFYIYQILNKVNNKRYIGSTKDFINRISHHVNQLKINTHYNRYLQRSYNKYGGENFSIDIVCYVFCENDDRDLLYEIERDHVDAYKTLRPLGYNLVVPKNTPGHKRGEESPMWGSKRSDETKAKLRAAHLGKPKPSLIGRFISEETRKKMSLAKKGRKLTPEQIEVLRKANLGREPWNKYRPMPDGFGKRQSCYVSGFNNPRAKLDKNDILEILSLKDEILKNIPFRKQLADLYGVCPGTIFKTVKRYEDKYKDMLL